MLLWMQDNLSTIITAMVLVFAVICVVLVMLRNKKKGRSSCGGSCAGCVMASNCHKKPDSGISNE